MNENEIPIYQIDAFTSEVFRGNPAAVCPLDEWLPDETMRKIANENNLSETAFFVEEGEHYHIRWFTPQTEVKLCGHATLASAYVIFNELGYRDREINFRSESGNLYVSSDNEWIVMDFPSQPPVPCEPPQALTDGLGNMPAQVLKSEDYIAVFDSEEEILSLNPDYETLKNVPLRGISVTARGISSDFVSRFFAPKVGINEDPVTGSAHCELTPYWWERLGKKKLYARQLSGRGGEIFCELKNDRVFLRGRAVKYMEGKAYIKF